MTADNETQLRELVDREEIRDLMARYYQAVDRRDFDAVDACFTEDAVVDFMGNIRSGRTDIREYISGVARYAVTTHFMGNHLAEITEDSADVETYAIAHHRDDGTDVPQYVMIALRYVDRMVRQNGSWVVVNRVMVEDWRRNDQALPLPR